MSEQLFGTIAALEFCVHPRQGFEDIVEDLDISFQPTGLTRRTLIWDGDDVAIIERDALRILLNWLPPEHPDDPAYLLMAIGQSPISPHVHVGIETCHFVKDVLLAHLASYLPVSSVLHKDAHHPISADLIDAVADDILMQQRDTTTTRPQGFETQSQDHAARSPLNDPPSDMQDAPDDVIEAEFSDLSDDCSLPKRLTIYTLGATMLFYTPPVGATLLIYSTLRDFAPSQRLTLGHTPPA